MHDSLWTRSGYTDLLHPRGSLIVWHEVQLRAAWGAQTKRCDWEVGLKSTTCKRAQCQYHESSNREGSQQGDIYLCSYIYIYILLPSCTILVRNTTLWFETRKDLLNMMRSSFSRQRNSGFEARRLGTWHTCGSKRFEVLSIPWRALLMLKALRCILKTSRLECAQGSTGIVKKCDLIFESQNTVGCITPNNKRPYDMLSQPRSGGT